MIMLTIMTKVGGKGPGIVAALFLFIFNTFFAIGWLGMTCKTLAVSMSAEDLANVELRVVSRRLVTLQVT